MSVEWSDDERYIDLFRAGGVSPLSHASGNYFHVLAAKSEANHGIHGAHGRMFLPCIPCDPWFSGAAIRVSSLFGARSWSDGNRRSQLYQADFLSHSLSDRSQRAAAQTGSALLLQRSGAKLASVQQRGAGSTFF